jgi:hypothetical protein
MDLNDLLVYDLDESIRYEKIASYVRSLGIASGFELSFGKDGVTIKHPDLAKVDQLKGLITADKIDISDVAARRDAMSKILDEGF